MNRLSLCLVLNIFCSLPLAAQWIQIGLSERGIGEVTVGNSELFAITNDSGCVFRSTDGGTNWALIVQSHGSHIAVAPNGTTFMVRADSLYRSAEGGNFWTNLQVFEQVPPVFGEGWFSLCRLAVAQSGVVFCGLVGGGITSGTSVAISTDNGSTWTATGRGGSWFAFRGNSVITCGWTNSIFPGAGFSASAAASMDGGQTWVRLSYPRSDGFGPLSWCSNGSILSRELNGLYLSADTGATCFMVSRLLPSTLLALPQGVVLVGTDTAGIHLFNDNGDSLGTLNEGLTDLHVHTLVLDNAGYVYAGTNKGVWRRPLSEVDPPNGIAPTVLMPTTFRLEQNYPNPFNPVTNIQFTIVNRQLTIVRVHDVLGRELATLVNEVKEPGTYTVQLDGSNLASGVYFYRLQAGDFVQSKRLILLK